MYSMCLMGVWVLDLRKLGIWLFYLWFWCGVVDACGLLGRVGVGFVGWLVMVVRRLLGWLRRFGDCGFCCRFACSGGYVVDGGL